MAPEFVRDDFLTRPLHLLDDAPDDDRPRQVLWAKIDHVELSPRGTLTFLDSVDAEWFDASFPSERGWLTHPVSESGQRVSIVALAAKRLPRGHLWYQIVLDQGRVSAPFRAHEIDVTSEPVALQYDTFLGLPTPRRLLTLRPAASAEAARLGAAGSLAADADASRDTIKRLLDRAGPVTSVAVLDVGQGNWNALLENGVARLLFDLGGGVLTHLATFPLGFRSFCFAEDPPVVLSHWDWDHWSSAVRFPDAQHLTWIVPRQHSLGPTHAQFLAALRTNGHVVIYPRGEPPIRTSMVEIQQAAGRLTNSNESGLALIVKGAGAKVLLPGDAGYATLALPTTLTSVVVPHHGGRTPSTAASLPASDGSSAGRAVFSYGRHNHFGHPTTASRALHTKWAKALLETANRVAPDEPAHVELHWRAPAAATPPCCASSALPLPQR